MEPGLGRGESARQCRVARPGSIPATDQIDIIQVNNEDLIWEQETARLFERALHAQAKQKWHKGIALFPPFALRDGEAVARIILPEVPAWLAIPQFDEWQNC